MPLYMDIHALGGAVTPEEVERVHLADVEAQGHHGVRYLKYFCDPERGRVFCLVDAPSPEAAAAVHRESGAPATSRIIPVDLAALDQFLGGGGETPLGAALLPSAPQALDGGFRTILFTDIHGSTPLTQRLGDREAMAVLRAHNAIVREVLGRAGGREVKNTGDGFMASFFSPSAAVQCARDIQTGLARYENAHPNASVRVRIGLSAGEPVEEADDLFGTTVQMAARVCAHAQPGQILVANVVAELCLGKRLPFVALGEISLKGFEVPVRLFEVPWSQAPQ